MPGQLSKHAGLDTIFRIGTAIEVLSVELLALRVLKKIPAQQFELGRGQLAVLLPPYRFFGVLVADDELVLGAATGVDAGFGAKCPALNQISFAVRKRMLVKRRLGQIPVDSSKTRKPKPVGAMGAVA